VDVAGVERGVVSGDTGVDCLVVGTVTIVVNFVVAGGDVGDGYGKVGEVAS